MKVKNFNTTKSALIATPLPEETSTYKPVTHEQLMDLTNESIVQSGFALQRESYTMAREGNVANGKYTISNIADKEMQIQIGWQNSYNKQLSLKFAIGAHIFICANGMVSGDMGSFRRKHTGDIQEFTPKHIIEYIKTAGEVFISMQKEREKLKNIELTKRTTAELLGRMYLEEGFITSTQLNIIKGQLEHPTYDYGVPNSAWELYQFVTYSLKNDHPSDWMNDHVKAHEFFTKNDAGIYVPENIEEDGIIHEHTIPIDDGQLDWTEEVKKLENELG